MGFATVTIVETQEMFDHLVVSIMVESMAAGELVAETERMIIW